MTTEYSISIDWHNEYQNHPDKWINHGADAIYMKELERLEKCKHGNKDNSYCHECECYPDDKRSDAEPMMNYAYPLHHEPTDEEILKVIENTNCTIMENQDTGDWFLVLNGGGMDLSQSVAYAYMICGYIPDALAFNVITQYGFNISGKTYFKVMEKVKESLSNTIEAYKSKIKRIDEAVKEAKVSIKNK